MPPGLDQPIRLEPIFRERVWGRRNLSPFFPDQRGNNVIGEVWFTFEENSTALGPFSEILKAHPEVLGTAADPRHPAACPLLIKFIFTSERLSVQVHPDDEYAERHHRSRGKTEAWYVIDSQPPGELAVGFKETLDPERFQTAVRSGEIEQLLAWRQASPGDVIFVPAGTVHAIGAGLTIYEVQENSDITYRLYDYGRPRELHLAHGLRVSHLGPHDSRHVPVPLASWRDHLLQSNYFHLERLHPNHHVRIAGGLPYYLLLTCIKGSGTVADEPFVAGQTWFVPAHSAEVEIVGPASEWILAYTADEPAVGFYGS